MEKNSVALYQRRNCLAYIDFPYLLKWQLLSSRWLLFLNPLFLLHTGFYFGIYFIYRMVLWMVDQMWDRYLLEPQPQT